MDNYLRTSPKKLIKYCYDDAFTEEKRTDLYCDLLSLAFNAEEAHKLIVEEYSVWLEQSSRFRTLVWSDDDEFDSEYLNKLWIWQANYCGIKASVHCSLNGIYKLYRKEYMMDNGLLKPEKNYKVIPQAFRDFVEFTKLRIEVRKELDYDPRLPRKK